MNRKLKGAVDVAMSVALLFLMGYQFWGDEAHDSCSSGLYRYTDMVFYGCFNIQQHCFVKICIFGFAD